MLHGDVSTVNNYNNSENLKSIWIELREEQYHL